MWCCSLGKQLTNITISKQTKKKNIIFFQLKRATKNSAKPHCSFLSLFFFFFFCVCVINICFLNVRSNKQKNIAATNLVKQKISKYRESFAIEHCEYEEFETKGNKTIYSEATDAAIYPSPFLLHYTIRSASHLQHCIVSHDVHSPQSGCTTFGSDISLCASFSLSAILRVVVSLRERPY